MSHAEPDVTLAVTIKVVYLAIDTHLPHGSQHIMDEGLGAQVDTRHHVVVLDPQMMKTVEVNLIIAVVTG